MGGPLPRLVFIALTLPVTVWSAWAPQVSPGSDSAQRQSGPVQRALFINAGLLPFITADEGSRHVEAIGRFGPYDREPRPLPRIFPQLQSLPSFHGGVAYDPEQILLRDSDAVFVWEDRGGLLKNIGAPHVVEMVTARRFDTLDMWALFGELTGKQAHADALAARYLAQRESLSALLAADTPPPVVMLIVGGFEHGIWLADHQHRLAARFQAVKALLRPQNERNGDADFEEILRLDPDVIFLDPSGTGDRISPSQLYAQERWQSLRAVAQRRVYEMPLLPEFVMPVEDPIRLQWLAEVLYPDRVPKQARAQVRDTFEAAYHYTTSEDDIDAVLRCDDNRDSAGADRFCR